MDNFLYLPRSLAAFLFDLAFACSFGSLFAQLWMRSPQRLPDAALSEEPLQPCRRALTLCAATMLIILPIQLWLLAATMLSSTALADIRPLLWDVLTGTHAGRVLMPDFVCALLLLLVSLNRSRAAFYVGPATAFILAAFRSASGHAASNGSFSLGEVVQFLHLTSIAVWAGGVMVAGLLILPRLPTPEAATAFGRRLSQAATIAIVVVALSGLYNSWIGLDGSLKPLPHTQWGILLLIKSALVLAALALGANNRLLLARNPTLSPADAMRFTRSMRSEAVVMIAILAVSGFLANSPPAFGN